ncbi:hypothetical protein JNJ66_07715 [Candidatus Saccharibacteria bacterium]|nr:hypothetical protein [Candidatus Saccharibacteria bacterium]
MNTPLPHVQLVHYGNPYTLLDDPDLRTLLTEAAKSALQDPVPHGILRNSPLEPRALVLLDPTDRYSRSEDALLLVVTTGNGTHHARTMAHQAAGLLRDFGDLQHRYAGNPPAHLMPHPHENTGAADINGAYVGCHGFGYCSQQVATDLGHAFAQLLAKTHANRTSYADPATIAMPSYAAIHGGEQPARVPRTWNFPI